MALLKIQILKLLYINSFKSMWHEFTRISAQPQLQQGQSASEVFSRLFAKQHQEVPA